MSSRSSAASRAQSGQSSRCACDLARAGTAQAPPLGVEQLRAAPSSHVIARSPCSFWRSARPGAGQSRLHRAHRAADDVGDLDFASGPPGPAGSRCARPPRASSAPPRSPRPTTLRSRSSSTSPSSHGLGPRARAPRPTVSRPPTVGSLRWRRYGLRNVFRRIRNSHALRFVPGVNWCAPAAPAHTSPARGPRRRVSLPVRYRARLCRAST